jgi:nucleotide-binding universal stress UspA family protein
MASPRRFLVATDLSPAAEAALDFALDLAERSDGYVVLLHVCRPPHHWGPAALSHEVSRALDEARVAAGEAIGKIVDAKRSRGVHIDVAIQSGEPWQRIAATARELDVDMVVMATDASGDAREPRLGGVTKRVVRAASCPVLTVPRESIATLGRRPESAAAMPVLTVHATDSAAPTSADVRAP